MSPATDPAIRGLCDCDCCNGTGTHTPADVINRPGLSAIVYRVGTHAAFKGAMLASLSDARRRAIGSFNTRDDDDFSIALLDSWAMVADVLSFYQERIANESYLRTATERRSVLELARTIGYELAPGVAASTWLAFTVENPTAGLPQIGGKPGVITIPGGTRAQSIPGQGERPQSFETSGDIEARPEWNALKPRAVRHRLPAIDDEVIYLKGTATGLREGDPLIIVGDERKGDPGSERWECRLVRNVEVVVSSDPAAGYTVVSFDHPLGSRAPLSFPPAMNPRVYALRQRAGLFGANAPDWNSMPMSLRRAVVGSKPADTDPTDTEWPGFTIRGVSGIPEDGVGGTPAPPSTTVDIYLDSLYPRIFAGGWAVLSSAEERELYYVESVAEASRTGFTLNARSTRLRLSGEHLLAKFDKRLRDTAVYAVSEELEIAGTPITDPVAGGTIELEGNVEGLRRGGLLAVTGIDAATGAMLSEVAAIGEVSVADGVVRVKLAEDLIHRFHRESVTINANVAPATHGERKEEVLGSGDASRTFQRFALRGKPLTYVGADNPRGGVSTLQVRINGVLWDEVPSLYGRSPREHVYITRTGDDGITSVIFGDGRTGSRLPTGIENVTAVYRVGIGEEGEVDAGKIALLTTRPLGVKGVLNPVAATGAADPQSADDSRDNAPRTVLALGRIVSLRDFEDFARTFAGVGKALATWTWNRDGRGVLLTVAGDDGDPIPEGSRTQKNLLAAITAAGDPHIPVQVRSYRPVSFTVRGRAVVDARYLPEAVAGAIERALRFRFSFAARSFGQPVDVGEVIATVQGVPGVLFADIDEIRRKGAPDAPSTLPADYPQPGAIASAALPAELLTLDPDPLDGLEVTQWVST